MQYTTLGKLTGLKVSVLGFGAMRLPMKGDRVDFDKSTAMMHRAFDAGVNYVDSAVGYCNRDSQTAIGKALEGRRDGVIISTKNPNYRRSDHDLFWRNLEESLKKLRVDCIDLYNFHGLRWQAFVDYLDGKGGSYEWIAQAKEQGLIRHIGFSFHDSAEALENLARTGLFEVVTCQYNLLDRTLEKAFPAVKRAGLGIVVMGPVGGGRLGAPSEEMQKLIPGARSVPEAALRFVLSNPHVDVALSGMSEMSHVEENCRVAATTAALSAAERRRVGAILNRYRKLAELYCTGCKYCMPCPAGVNIPGCFDALNRLRVYGLAEAAKTSYQWTDNGAGLCIACGRCLKKCPQNIDIISQLRETVRRLDDCYGRLAVTLHPFKATACVLKNGVANVRLAARLECVNYRDEDIRPEISFAPGRGVRVEPARPVGNLTSFARQVVPVTIETRVRPGEPFQTGLGVSCDTERVVSPPTMRLAVARTGGKGSLAKAPRQKVRLVPAGLKASGAPGHALEFALAYDRKSLWMRAKVCDDGLHPAKNSRGRLVTSGDRLELFLDLVGLARPQGQRPPRLKWHVLVGLPDADTGACPVHVVRPRWARVEGISVASRKTAGGWTLDIQIPFKGIDCPPGAAGRTFGLNVVQVSHSARGKTHWHRQWAQGDGWAVLA